VIKWPWQRTFGCRGPPGVRSIHARDLYSYLKFILSRLLMALQFLFTLSPYICSILFKSQNVSLRSLIIIYHALQHCTFYDVWKHCYSTQTASCPDLPDTCFTALSFRLLRIHGSTTTHDYRESNTCIRHQVSETEIEHCSPSLDHATIGGFCANLLPDAGATADQ